MTRVLKMRLAQHALDKDWWPEVDPARTTFTTWPSHDAAAEHEAVMIAAERPLYNVATWKQATHHKPALVMRSHRYPAKLYEAAMAKAAERQENLSDVLREALERYVREES
jgi:hypothetical protein